MNNLNLLRGSSVYLVGPIDHSGDPHKWRKDITNDLLKPLGIKVYDPLIKPLWLPSYSRCGPSIYKKIINKSLKSSVNLDNNDLLYFEYGIKMVRDIDLRFANDCNFMICHLPKIPTYGTMEEIKVATDAKKPILFHMPDGVVSTWLPAQYASSIYEYSENHFENWNSLYNYVRGVDSGSIDVDNFKWIFMSYHNDVYVQSRIGDNNE